MTRKWIEVNDLLSGQYSVNKNIRFKAPMLRSSFCDNSDVYVVVKGTNAGAGTNVNNPTNKELAIRNNASLKLITHS